MLGLLIFSLIQSLTCGHHQDVFVKCGYYLRVTSLLECILKLF